MFVVVTKSNYVPFAGHDFTGVKSKTEKKGYIPARKQIENLMLEGKKLDAYRTGRYLYNAHSFENMTSVDYASLKIPFYNDELSLAEKSAYFAGVKQAFVEKLATLNKDKARAEEEKKVVTQFNDFVAAVKSAYPQASEAVKPDAKT